MIALQKNIYEALLQDKTMDKDTAREATITFEPCYCIVLRRNRKDGYGSNMLEYQGMQRNDIVIFSKYKYTNGFDVRIFPASYDFKLLPEQWADVKDILKQAV